MSTRDVHRSGTAGATSSEHAPLCHHEGQLFACADLMAGPRKAAERPFRVGVQPFGRG
jgi:hypothetical protein